MRKLLAILPALALALTASWTLPVKAQDADPEWQKVVEAAKEEGGVTFYASFLGADFQKEIVNTFTEEYGIPVTVLDVRAPELRERIRTEYATNRVAGDVHWTGFSVLQMIADGQIGSIGDLPNAKNVSQTLQNLITDQYVPTHAGFYGIMINTNEVKPEDEPKSWNDLLDPKWKGRILSDDMRAQGGGLNMFAALYNKYGREFHETFATQELTFSRDIGNDERRVARGEYPLRIPQFYGSFGQLEGLPVKFIMPEEGAPYTQGLMVMLEGAPHPNAARLFINHYLSERVQLMFAQNGVRPVMDGLGDKVDTERGKLAANVTLLGTALPDQMDQLLEMSNEIYK